MLGTVEGLDKGQKSEGAGRLPAPLMGLSE